MTLSSAGKNPGTALRSAAFPAEHAGAVNGIFEAGGSIALTSLPPEAPGFIAQPLAVEALGQGLSGAFVVRAAAALAGALLTLVVLLGVPSPDAGEEWAA